MTRWMLFCALQLFACTGIELANVNGRTLEFGIEVETYVAVIPRNYAFKNYTSKYAAVGVYCFNESILIDGMNEKGLVAAAFYFPGFASYSTEGDGTVLSPIEFPNWALTCCATVDEVKEVISTISITPIVEPAWGARACSFSLYRLW